MIISPNFSTCQNCQKVETKTTHEGGSAKANVSEVIKRFNSKSTVTTATAKPEIKPSSQPAPAPAEKPKPSVLKKYQPVDTTTNIPVIREKWDNQLQTVKTVVEVVRSSPTLSQKPKFPQKGAGKPLRGHNPIPQPQFT